MADRGRKTKPSCNPIITARYDARVKKLHAERLKRVQPSIDNKPPARMKHLYRNLKREQQREERYSAIERENRILLEKMSGILHGGHSLDNVRTSKPRSMNRLVRRAELMRITEENQRILKRIQRSEPTYNHLAWEAERHEHERHLRSLSEYAPDGREKVKHYIEAEEREVTHGGAGAGAGGARGVGGRKMRPASAPVRRVEDGSAARAGRRPRPASSRHPGREPRYYDRVGGGGGGGDGGGRVAYVGGEAEAEIGGGGGGGGGRARPISAGPRRPGARAVASSGAAPDDADVANVFGDDDEAV